MNGQSYMDTCWVTVEEPSIRLSSSSLSMNVGDTETLSASVVPSGSYVSWSSSDTNVATVNRNGKVSAVSAGSTTVVTEINFGGTIYEDYCNIDVKTISPQLPPSGYEIYEGNYDSFEIVDGIPTYTLYADAYGGTVATITVEPYEDNYTRIDFYRDGKKLEIQSISGSRDPKSKSFSQIFNSTGVWTFYAEVTNDYGSFIGSSSSFCIRVRVVSASE